MATITIRFQNAYPITIDENEIHLEWHNDFLNEWQPVDGWQFPSPPPLNGDFEFNLGAIVGGNYRAWILNKQGVPVYSLLYYYINTFINITGVSASCGTYDGGVNAYPQILISFDCENCSGNYIVQCYFGEQFGWMQVAQFTTGGTGTFSVSFEIALQFVGLRDFKILDVDDLFSSGTFPATVLECLVPTSVVFQSLLLDGTAEISFVNAYGLLQMFGTQIGFEGSNDDVNWFPISNPNALGTTPFTGTFNGNVAVGGAVYYRSVVKDAFNVEVFSNSIQAT